MLDIVPSCNPMYYHEKLTKLEKITKKTNFGTNFGPFGPNLGPKDFLQVLSILK